MKVSFVRVGVKAYRTAELQEQDRTALLKLVNEVGLVRVGA